MTEYLLLQALNGLIIGLIYALMALGLTIIFSILKVVNFAHGEFYMLGGFAAYYVAALLPVSTVVAVLCAMGILFLFGMLVEGLLLRPLYTGRVERKDEYAILVTFGLSIFLQNFALSLFGPWTRRLPSLLSGRVSIGFLTISNDRLLVSLIALLCMVVALALIARTFVGKGLRAVSQDREAAAIVGINPFRMQSLAFGIGSALAGGAGALIGPIFFVSPTMGTMPAIKAFVIIVLGGMGSLPGSILGSLILGEVESLGSVLFPDPTRGLAYKNA
ncbi:MAG: branched-chain amino acid ABC transporter permease, partial [Nitrospinota bacterium]